MLQAWRCISEVSSQVTEAGKPAGKMQLNRKVNASDKNKNRKSAWLANYELIIYNIITAYLLFNLDVFLPLNANPTLVVEQLILWCWNKGQRCHDGLKLAGKFRLENEGILHNSSLYSQNMNEGKARWYERNLN